MTNLFLGNWRPLKSKIPIRHRTKKMMPWKLVEHIWRRKHDGNWWNAVIRCLREVQFTPGTSSSSSAMFTEVIELPEGKY